MTNPAEFIMKKRLYNPKRAKTKRNYTVGEIADLYDVHKITVRAWIKAGLPTLNDQRPMLILGGDLAAFHQARRTKNKQKCKPGEMYCLKCRAPKKPDGEVEYQQKTAALGNLVGICQDCYSIMNRRISHSKLDQFCREMDITLPQALRHIYESGEPTVNINFKEEAETC